MPNGKPGDHPLTDILVHRLRTYGYEADELVRKIAEISSRRELDEWWNKEIGWKASSRTARSKARARFAELTARAKASGWETPQ